MIRFAIIAAMAGSAVQPQVELQPGQGRGMASIPRSYWFCTGNPTRPDDRSGLLFQFTTERQYVLYGQGTAKQPVNSIYDGNVRAFVVERPDGYVTMRIVAKQKADAKETAEVIMENGADGKVKPRFAISGRRGSFEGRCWGAPEPAYMKDLP